MDDQEEDNLSPFWLPNTNPRLRRRDSFSLIFNSGFILIFLLAIAFVLIFVIIPSCLSFTAKIVKPHMVKRGWDSLNLVLVLFAIVCAFLSKTSNSNTSSSRSNDNNSAVSSSSYYGDRNMYGEATNEAQKSNPSTPQSNDRWYDFPDRTSYNKLNRLRSGRSYPDLRQELSWVTGDERWRFYDDTFVSQRSDQWLHESQEVRDNRTGSTKEEVEVNNSASITRQKEASLPPPTSLRPAPEPLSPQPQAPPVAIQSSQQQPPQSSQALLSKAVRRKAKRRHDEEDNGREGGSEKKDEEVKNVIYQPQTSPATPPPPPPPSPPPVFSNGGKKRGKDILTSLRRRKKKQRQKSVENLESLFDPQLHNLPLQPPPSPPAPPPPPPQPAFLQGLFSSKKGKAKKVQSVPAAVPPAPPPLPRVSRNVYNSAQSLEARVLITKAQRTQAAADKAPKPVKTGIYHSAADENLDSGNASPLIPIPPPPPPPPFKMPVWRYVVEGDYVRLKSISRSASPELEDPSDKESSPSAMDGTSSPLFCPSPDVNTKADNFIARFKETLRLEKAKSINDRRRSNLGPETTQGPAIEGPS